MGLPFYLVPFITYTLVLLGPPAALQIMPPRKLPSGATSALPMKVTTAMKTIKAAVSRLKRTSAADLGSAMKRTNSSSAPTVPKARAGKPAGSVRSKQCKGVVKSNTEAYSAASDSGSGSLSKRNAKKKDLSESILSDAEVDMDAESPGERVETASQDGRFCNVTSYQAPLPFDATAAKILPGLARVVRHLLNTGSNEVEALYYVQDRLDQADGLLCECTIEGVSGKAHSHFLSILNGSDHVLYLFSSTDGCLSLWNRPSVLHVLVWKPLVLSELTDPWITTSMIEKFMQLLEETGSESESISHTRPLPELRSLLKNPDKHPTQTERHAQALQSLSKPGCFTSVRPITMAEKVSISPPEDDVISSNGEKASGKVMSSGFPPVPPPLDFIESASQVIPASTNSKALARLKKLAELGISEFGVREVVLLGKLDENVALFSK